MIPIDRARLSELAYRVDFDRQFIEFTKEDASTLNAAAPLLLPIITDIVEGLYEHLFEWSYTKEPFTHRNTGFEGDLKSIDDLSLDDPQMLLRKKMMTMWTAKILTSDYEDPKTFEYMDKVGVMHTGVRSFGRQPGFAHRENKEPLFIDLQALSLTLGWVTDVVLTIVMSFPRTTLSTSKKMAVLRAFNKVVWIQQDLFARHYTRTDEEAAVNLARINAEKASEQEKERIAKEEEEEAVEDKLAQLAVKDLPDVSL
ncbi:Protoglobin-domain-containing protein [Leucosporidium creatinivorum]|uniref:Protoglobin-domain-containing protein n=1 Tax=Leucosporidium creatinivorum TaxID=106004 RepID=A0A1Y2F652_9BASI|nr:Protoglobin-domain-containing protein [Leucosporidium creatinivorum]